MRERWELYLEKMSAALSRQNIDDIQLLLNERKKWNEEGETWTKEDVPLLERILESDRKVATWMEKEHRDLGVMMNDQNRIHRVEKKYRNF